MNQKLGETAKAKARERKANAWLAAWLILFHIYIIVWIYSELHAIASESVNTVSVSTCVCMCACAWSAWSVCMQCTALHVRDVNPTKMERQLMAFAISQWSSPFSTICSSTRKPSNRPRVPFGAYCACRHNRSIEVNTWPAIPKLELFGLPCLPSIAVPLDHISNYALSIWRGTWTDLFWLQHRTNKTTARLKNPKTPVQLAFWSSLKGVTTIDSFVATE